MAHLNNALNALNVASQLANQVGYKKDPYPDVAWLEEQQRRYARQYPSLWSQARNALRSVYSYFRPRRRTTRRYKGKFNKAIHKTTMPRYGRFPRRRTRRRGGRRRRRRSMYGRKRMLRRNGKFRRFGIKRRPRMPRGLSKMYVEKTTSTIDLSCSDNLTSMSSNLCVIPASTANGLFSKYVQIGETDANAEREETFDLEQWDNQKLFVRSTTEMYRMRNNNLGDVYVWIYVVMPKFRTNNHISSEFASSLNDKAGTDADWEQEPSFYPDEMSQVRKNYKFLVKKHFMLTPGQSVDFLVKGRPYTFSNEMYDRHPFTYYPGLSTQVLIRIRGPVAHDGTTTSNIGYAAASLDIVTERTIKWHFIKAGDLGRWVYSDNLSAMTNAEQAMPDQPVHIEDAET